jgi:hypothetical protein
VHTADPRLARHRLPALLFAGFLLVIAGSAAVIFALKLGTAPSRVAAYYRGDAATYAQPKSFDGLLLVAVPHLAGMPIVLFAAAHVVGWARALSRRAYQALLAISFGGAALSIVTPFLTRFVAPAAAWLKLAAFAGLESALLAWAALLVAVFLPLRARDPVALRAPAAAPARTGRRRNRAAS